MNAHTLYLISGPILFAASNDDAKQLAQALQDHHGELARLRAENIDLCNFLFKNGFRRCDVPSCNCGSWHPRFALPERMAEIKDALADAGHPLSNDNGNKPLNALAGLVSERDALRAEVERLRADLNAAQEGKT